MTVLAKLFSDFLVNNYLDRTATIIEKILVICSTKYHRSEKNKSSPNIEYSMIIFKHIVILRVYLCFFY